MLKSIKFVVNRTTQTLSTKALVLLVVVKNPTCNLANYFDINSYWQVTPNLATMVRSPLNYIYTLFIRAIVIVINWTSTLAGTELR